MKRDEKEAKIVRNAGREHSRAVSQEESKYFKASN